jgi:hypothetical protein
MPHFEGASGFTVYNSSFLDVTYRGVSPNISESCCSVCGSWLGADDDEGQKLLTEASLFNAIYDSATQENLDPPLPATQHERLTEELEDLISEGETSFRVLVSSGPRSNLAYLCAKRLEDGLCTSFFVSQSLQTEDHVRFFPTIAWQLSIQFPAYSNLLEKELRHDPSLLHKALEVQFKKLIAEPFRQLLTEGHDFGQRNVIVIDGLEEYRNVQAHLKILHIILSRAGELPFIWLIFGRLNKVLDRLVVEMGPIVEIHLREGYPTLKMRTHPRGTLHGFLLLHSQSCFSALQDFESKNIVLATSFFFFLIHEPR